MVPYDPANQQMYIDQLFPLRKADGELAADYNARIASEYQQARDAGVVPD